MKSSIAELFEEWVDKNPSKIACVQGEEQITYEILNNQANQFAQYLKDQGLVPYTVVALWGKPSISYLITLLGILKAGGAYVCLSHQDPLMRQDKILQNLHPAFIVCTEDIQVSLPKTNAKLIFFEDLVQEMNKNEMIKNHFISSQDDRLATIIYRSDRSGVPVGVMIEQRAIINLLAHPADIPFSPDHTFINLSKPETEYAIFEIWGALLNGATLCIVDESYIETLSDSKMICIAHYFQFETWRHHAPSFIEACEYVFVKDLPMLEKLPKNVMPVYGPIESTVFCMCAGNVIRNMKVEVLDKKGRSVEIGKIGEIYIGGVGIARGYFDHLALTQERFIHHAGERLYKTGDMAKRGSDGRFEYQGRLDRQWINIDGKIVCPEEIELALKEAADVNQAVVFFEQNVNQESELVAYLTPSENLVRIFYEGSCHIEWEDEKMEVVKVKDISQGGICVSGTTRTIVANETLIVHLPDLLGEQSIPSRAVWQSDKTIGINFLEKNEKINQYIRNFFKKNCEYIKQKRNYIKFLENKLPAYMMPRRVIPLSSFPIIERGYDRAIFKRIYDSVAQEIPPVEESRKQKNQSKEEIMTQLKRDFFSESGGETLGKKVLFKLKNHYHILMSPRKILANPLMLQLALMVAKTVEDSLHDPIASVSRNRYVALSSWQEKMLSIDKKHTPSHSHHVGVRGFLEGNLSVHTLKKALKFLQERHEILRTIYEFKKDENGIEKGQQKISSDFFSEITLLEGNPSAKKINQIFEETFDLTTGPLFRNVLIERAPTYYELMMVFHRSIMDGYSLKIVSHDLAEIYHALLEKRAPQLPHLSIQYIDYAVWEHAQNKKELSFSMGSHENTKKLGFSLDKSLFSALIGFSINAGATLPILLLTAFYTFLSQYLNKKEITVWTNVMERDREETSNLVGGFETMIPIGLHVKDNLKFNKLVELVKSDFLKNIKNIRNFNDDVKNNSVVFIFENDGNIETMDPVCAPHELVLKIVQKEEKIEGYIAYDRNIFSEESTQAWIEKWILTLQSISSNHKIPIQDIDFSYQAIP